MSSKGKDKGPKNKADAPNGARRHGSSHGHSAGDTSGSSKTNKSQVRKGCWARVLALFPFWLRGESRNSNTEGSGDNPEISSGGSSTDPTAGDAGPEETTGSQPTGAKPEIADEIRRLSEQIGSHQGAVRQAIERVADAVNGWSECAKEMQESSEKRHKEWLDVIEQSQSAQSSTAKAVEDLATTQRQFIKSFTELHELRDQVRKLSEEKGHLITKLNSVEVKLAEAEKQAIQSDKQLKSAQDTLKERQAELDQLYKAAPWLKHAVPAQDIPGTIERLEEQIQVRLQEESAQGLERAVLEQCRLRLDVVKRVFGECLATGSNWRPDKLSIGKVEELYLPPSSAWAVEIGDQAPELLSLEFQVERIRRWAKNELKRQFGLAEIEVAPGVTVFDDKYHEDDEVTRLPVGSRARDNIIWLRLKPGFLLHDAVLRRARVKRYVWDPRQPISEPIETPSVASARPEAPSEPALDKQLAAPEAEAAETGTIAIPPDSEADKWDAHRKMKE